MAEQGPAAYAKPEDFVEDVLRRVGRRIVLGAPVGIGKANHLMNALYRRAAEDREVDLTILTALSLNPPVPASELERRLVGPLAARLFGGYPPLEYAAATRAGKLPPNVRVHEFYFQPGGLLGSVYAQQHYVSSNYTHAARDVLSRGLNVLVQQVASRKAPGGTRLSLSCNADLTHEMLAGLREKARGGAGVLAAAQVNRNLPYMYGDAEIEPAAWDGVLDDPSLDFPLFAPPNQPVVAAEYALGLYASALVRDGGTLQLGIGALGDAIAYALALRHNENERWRAALGALDAGGPLPEIAARVGGLGPFERGLYAATEMMVSGFLQLYRAGVLRRTVYDHAGLQRLLDAGRIGETPDAAMLRTLADEGVVGDPLRPEDAEFLRTFGILREDARLEGGMLRAADGREAPARPAEAAAFLGPRLRGGCVAHASFFLGPADFYEALRAMPEEERERFHMAPIGRVNQLYGDEALRRVQRRDARFINTGLKATLLGAVASDGLEDGRVVSGVGGQYNFVAMAHALADGRSILLVRAVREDPRGDESGVVWSYGHATIPRHLRDVLVTEYGVAELRGKSDREVIEATIAVADARFQDGLAAAAKRAGKLPADWRVPDRCRANRPEELEKRLAPFRAEGLLPTFPFGTTITQEEYVLAKALRGLKARMAARRPPVGALLRALGAAPASAAPYLARMELDRPRDGKERMLRRLVLAALAADGAI